MSSASSEKKEEKVNMKMTSPELPLQNDSGVPIQHEWKTSSNWIPNEISSTSRTTNNDNATQRYSGSTEFQKIHAYDKKKYTNKTFPVATELHPQLW